MNLLRTAARAAVATRVIGSIHRHQQRRWAVQDPCAAAAGQVNRGPLTAHLGAVPVLERLELLGQLRDSGVLTEGEFAEQKQRIMSQQ